MNQLAIQSQQPISELEIMANHFVKSGLFGIRKIEEAVSLMIIAQAEGRHPGTVASEYHIIQGRPALKADAILARFQSANGKVEWHEYTDECVSGTFSHPAGGSLKVDWDMTRAKAAGLGGKDNWKKYPRQMLRARVISDGVRGVYPAVLQGFYTPEEVQDFAPSSPVAVPATPVEDKPKRKKAEPAPALVETTEVVEAVVEVVPTPAEIAEVVEDTDWQGLLSANEAAVNAFLTGKSKIAEGQTWRDLPDGEYLNRIKATPEKFVGAALEAAQ
jgi:hypothetical protein